MMHWMLAAALVSVSAAAAAFDDAKTASEESLLKRYAVAQCVARAYPGTAVQSDAHAAAGAYLEFGNSSAEVYEELSALAAAAAAQEYVAKSGAPLHVMKCIDLAYSPELQALVGHLLANDGE